ncbi:thioredoxin family protein [Paenibacillus sp. GCM10023252]|uniref:thioredoxin family protein n=1 Tax=Paenibacillus sp. GCM10023252 TaxID=3252649 RepID=UPI003609C4B9
MAIQEIGEDEWLRMVRIGQGRDAILFYTPFCGTCKVAERMLEVVTALPIGATLYRMNINFAPRLRDSWQIRSVPCLVLLQGGKPQRFEYAMRSVDYLYGLLKEE